MLKLRRSRKIVSLLVTLSFLMTLLVPMVGPAAAKSLNSVDKVLSVADDANIDADNAPVLTIREDSDFVNHFKSGDTFRLVLPTDVEWNEPIVKVNGEKIAAERRTDQVLEVTFPEGMNDDDVDYVEVALGVILDGVSGEVAVSVEPIDSAVTGGSYAFLVAGEGKTTAIAESVETIGKSGTGGVIRIEETYIKSIGDGQERLKLKLPGNFKWNNMTNEDISFSGGFSGATIDDMDGNGTTTLTVKFTPPADRGQRGTIYVTPKIKAESGASYGEIEVSIDGTDISDDDVVIAEYADWSVDVKVKEVKELVAGKFEQKTEKITIEEKVPGTFLSGRDLNIEFPDWVKVTRYYDASGTTADVTKPTINGDDSDFDITINSSSNSTKKIEFKLELSIEGNKSGDIEATISGAGVEDTTLVVAKALAPVDATVADVKDVKIGVQSQAISDITITENKKEAARYKAKMNAGQDKKGEVRLTLPDGVTFASTPKVEVTEGNLELKTEEARLMESDTVFTVPVKSESTKPSTIKVSGIKLTLDRTVPEGDLLIKVGGPALIENCRAAIGWLDGNTADGDSDAIDEGEFDTGNVMKVRAANCVTPAPIDLVATTIFTIGDTKYTVNGVEKTMDVAPYIKGDRTYLPIRFAAQAAGVADANIMWNDAERSVVLIKGDRVVKLVIDSNVMTINGVAFAMDVAPEIADPGRTMLPVRWVAQALGCDVDWDAETQTVTVR